MTHGGSFITRSLFPMVEILGPRVSRLAYGVGFEQPTHRSGRLCLHAHLKLSSTDGYLTWQGAVAPARRTNLSDMCGVS
jgi:hypothetical protein